MIAIRLALVLLFAGTYAGSALAQDSSVYYKKDYQQQALEIYRHLISVRSAAGHGKIPEVAEYLAEQFIAGGFDPDDVHVLPQTLSSGEEAASLVVRYRGDGSSGKKPILLIAHMDVVDAIASDWERDPFTLIEEDGFFFGRGTLDDKFGITTLTTTFLRLKRERYTPSRDLIIGFTGDEETGMETTRALATTHRDLTDAEYVLNADGGGGYQDRDGNALAYLLQAAEKTYASFDITVRNPGGHSSLPREDNAIYELAAVLKNIEAFEFPAKINAVTRRYFELAAPLSPEPVRSAMQAFAKDPTNEEAQAILSGIPSQVGLTRTTCVATMLKAGHAENALPQSATATVNCRIFPGETAEDVQATLERVADNPSIEIRLLAEALESPVSPMIEEVTAAVTHAVHDNYGDVPIIPYMAPYGTDGKEMRRADMPTYGVMGVFMKDEDVFAHGLNERVPVESFYKALEYWHQMLTELGGNTG
jgi:acetylornithine deacetylase/succinyl-diaminopimelate desuccinylase-like protein